MASTLHAVEPKLQYMIYYFSFVKVGLLDAPSRVGANPVVLPSELLLSLSPVPS